MALSAKLQIRQSQSLAMTPQLMQSIKLLQLSNLELSAFINQEMERNPLLELGDVDEFGISVPDRRGDQQTASQSPQEDGHAQSRDGLGVELEIDAKAIEGRLGTDLSNVFEDGGTGTANPTGASTTIAGRDRISSNTGSAGQAADYEAYVSSEVSLREHLSSQVALTLFDPRQSVIASELVDHIDDDGYLRVEIGEIAAGLGTNEGAVEAVLKKLQGFDPSGVFARALPECLAIQLGERNRLDPAMQAMLKNLDLLAKRDFDTLRTLCGVEREDLADMLEEIQALDPRPGSAFGNAPIMPIAPDVVVSERKDGGWAIELNSENLPKVLVNRSYYATVSKSPMRDDEKSFLVDCLQNANWLVRSLDQRAQTILKVATEIVRQQDGFLAYGVDHMRPLTLRTVADAIKMHESTVSRVTANKFMMTPRGLFELKYFFTPALAAGDGTEHSTEAVRHRIRKLIEAEEPDTVYSDDALVEELADDGIKVARRTVAKYREAMRIPSSIIRRREKRATMVH